MTDNIDATLKLSWLEASLTCTSELAEAVAEVFVRYTPDGVVLQQVTVFDQHTQEERPTGQMRVAAYLPNGQALEQTRRRLEESVWHLGQIAPLGPLQFAVLEDQDWMSAWKEHYQPLKIGRNLIVLPAWVDPAMAGDRIPIIISPDMAFGTGTHPSTQLCMIALEKYGSKGMDVFDIGCGSGILSIEAALLGAQSVIGVDTDPQSIPSSRRNAALNGLEGRIDFQQGTHTDLLARQSFPKQAQRVLANILAPVLIQMLENHLADLLAPGGLLILGGILDWQAQGVADTARENGLALKESLHTNDWVVLVFSKPK